eukprot:CAMPEP_0202458170 /NCGR_PEP_ID=MMETSP1360-20130828/22587_1 /ASSEMBLY_ACC=CAM_ASM_000848 /TAXON_ID=515479 /ORGANISM="Licmophora paradoxa, Strain CCMP2313" /LENGTH=181 /DNA_ID=CAMNT_0049078587 /DNA_START=8 /DNA_END=556 /DNA_ORIENTATION=-
MRTNSPSLIFSLLILFALTSPSVHSLMSPVPEKLKSMGITLKEPPAPKGNYVSCVQSGNLLFLCGHIPQKEDGSLFVGKVGKDLTVEEGYESAKACAINILATLSKELDGDWDRIVKIVKVVGFVSCADDFTQQPAVINGASDLFGEVFGPEIGLHARSAVGTNALPLNIATEVECIVEIK